MSPQRAGQEVPITEVRRLVGDRLREQKPAMEQEMFAHVGLFSPGDDLDPEYIMGLRESISIALEYGITCIESSERSLPPVPIALYAQARLAARTGVEIGIVIGRYVSGFNLLRTFVEEALLAEQLAGTKASSEIQRISALVIDRLVAEIAEQHADEIRRQAASPESIRLQQIRDLLNGKPIDRSQFGYDFDGFHIGIVANGPGAASAINGLAKALDCVALTVSSPDGPTWAWLGRREAPDINRIEKLVGKHWPCQSVLAIGEIGRSLTGWRLTHRQAEIGLLVSRKLGSFFRYGDDPLLATLLGDSVLAESFRQMYLEPLSRERDGGAKLRRTLHAYCTAERNGACAAQRLKISRQTVNNHLKSVEDRIGRPLASCIADIEAALRFAAICQADSPSLSTN